ncbi:MAG: hypothetical protein KY455_05785 [Euryarchaeota archaeon]|nr:hypothetical protein [Euryarchaeota archaeon]
MRAMVVAFGILMALPLLSAYVPTAEAATVDVSVYNFGFNPSMVSIAPGDSVRWTWNSGGTPHTVVEGTPGSAGATWCGYSTSPNTCTKTFSTVGTYDYFCSVHPSAMRGSVRVLAAPPTLTIDSPADGATVSGTFAVSGTASSDAGIAKVEVRIAGGIWQTASGTTAWSHGIDSTVLSNGDKTIEARATAGDGQTATATITVTVANPEVIDLWLRGLQGQTSLTGRPTIAAQVQNQGNVDLVTSVLFEYEYKGEWKTIRSEGINVPAFTIEVVSFTWSDIWLYGRFDIRATVDPTNVIAEDDETDNQRKHFAAFYANFVKGKDLRDV